MDSTYTEYGANTVENSTTLPEGSSPRIPTDVINGVIWVIVTPVVVGFVVLFILFMTVFAVARNRGLKNIFNIRLKFTKWTKKLWKGKEQNKSNVEDSPLYVPQNQEKLEICFKFAKTESLFVERRRDFVKVDKETCRKSSADFSLEERFLPEPSTPLENITTEHQARLAKVISIENATIPSTNCLNEDWKIKEEINWKKLKVSIHRSAVKLSFSEDIFKDRTDNSFALRGSIHTDLGKILKCIEIGNDRMLVSPVPEFHIGRNTMLNHYAITEIPLCVPCKSLSLKVHWMEIGKSNTKTSKEIPLIDYPSQTNLDVFYIIPNGRTNCVQVYSKHFSVFYCSICKEDIHLKLETEVYTREGSQADCPTVHVRMPLLGPYEMMFDCTEERKRKMEEINFRLTERMEIKLLKLVNYENTGLKFRLSSPSHWDHVIREDSGETVYKEEQIIDRMPSVECVNKCHLLGDGGGIQWKLKHRGPFTGRTSFTIDISNFHHIDDSKIVTTSLIPEFNLNGLSCTARFGARNNGGPRDILRHLANGLDGLEKRENLLRRLNPETNSSLAENVESFIDTLSDIQQQDSSFLSHLSLALEEMQLPFNEDISLFFYNFSRMDKTKVTLSHQTHLKCFDMNRSHPVQHDEIPELYSVKADIHVLHGTNNTCASANYKGMNNLPRHNELKQEPVMIGTTVAPSAQSRPGMELREGGIQVDQPSSATREENDNDFDSIQIAECGIHTMYQRK